MIFERDLMLSVDQPVTLDAPSADVIDLGAWTGRVYGAAAPLSPRDLGKGPAIPLAIQVTETFNNLTSLRVVVQVDDEPTFAMPRDVQEQILPLASLTAGRTFNMTAASPGTNERYARLFFDVTGGVPTAGRITAGMVAAVQTAGVQF